MSCFSLKYLVIALVCLEGVLGQSPLHFKARERGRHSHKFHKTNGVLARPHKSNTKADELRLPTSVIPSHYALEIMPVLDEGVPDIPQFSAPGRVVISVQCKEVTDRITMHSSPILKITENTVEVKEKDSNTIVAITEHAYVEEYDFYTIVLGQSLVLEKEYVITIEFVAPVSTTLLSGLYRAQFTQPGSTDINYMAVTQFAATYARQAFPCFDEPNFKATFDIKIGRAQRYRALSNSMLKESVPIGDMPGWFWDTFETTEKMSSYLVALVVAPETAYTFYETEIKLEGDKPVRVYAPDFMIKQNGGKYAAEVSANAMNFYAEYFDMPFKMPKMDSATIPSFTFGAMENFGLITYREPLLLFFEGETTETERRRITGIVSHESSHQWFGNVVTCKFWNHVWLNEGFATYLSYLGVLETHPEFQPLEHALNEAFQLSMPFDTDPDFSHPVLNDALYPEQIFAYFDEISYEKAGSLIKMMEGFLTPATLKTGLRKYLVAKELQGAEQDDLFQVLTDQGHEDGTLDLDITVKDIMDTWTLQPGFPLLRVTRLSNSKIYVSQERFNDDLKKFPSTLDPAHLWHVPVALVTEKEPLISRVPEFWLNKDVLLKSYTHNTSEWIMLNPDATGYFRVLYDAPLIQLIQNQLTKDHTVISGLSRSQLLDDYLVSAFHDYGRLISIETALDLTKYLGKETEWYVWNAVFANLEYTYNRLAGTEAFPPFKAYFMPMLDQVIDRLGLEQIPADAGAKTIFRAQVLDWSCALDISTCTDEATRLVADWMTTGINSISIDLQEVYYCTGVAKGDATIFNFFFGYYAAVDNTARQKALALGSLACLTDSASLQSLLEKTLEPEATSRIKVADRLALVQKIAANIAGRPLVINFLISKLDQILTEFGGQIAIRDIFGTLGIFAGTPEEHALLQNFINENTAKLGDVLPELNKSLDLIGDNIKWQDMFFDRIKNWFEIAVSA